MKTSLKLTALGALLSISSLASAVPEGTKSPYSGQQTRAIKSLSQEEVAGLLAGKGAGFAKAAELNGYPGPAHVLELAEPLRLDDSQLDATRRLMAAHNDRASQLGAALLSSERALDALFADKRVDAAAIDRATQRVGELQARLRAEHLTTHLAQTALLSAEQVRRYSVLRGYEPTESDVLPAKDNPPYDGTAHRH